MPLALRITSVLGVLILVADSTVNVAFAISVFGWPPTLTTNGLEKVPPKSPANIILPAVLDVALGTPAAIFVLVNALFTNAVVAIAVEISPALCVTAIVPVGSVGVPVNTGDTKFDFKFNAVNCALLTGLLASLVLSTLPNPKFVLASFIFVAFVPPFAIAKSPVIFAAVPVTLPMKLVAVIAPAAKLPSLALLTIVLPTLIVDAFK